MACAVQVFVHVTLGSRDAFKTGLRVPFLLRNMVVSQNGGTPIQIPEYNGPYDGNPKKGSRTTNFGKPPYTLTLKVD